MALSFNSIKSLFVVEDPEETQQVKTENTTENPKKEEPIKKEESKVTWKTSSTAGVQTSNPETQKVSADGVFNQTIFNSLTKAISDANLDGEDYLEFVQALKAMKDIPLDLDIKIKTVLATLSTKGLTVQKVIESSDYYLSVLENEKRKFGEVIKAQKENGIGSKLKEIETLEVINKDKAAQIEKLSNEIKENQDKINSVKTSISESEGKIVKAEHDFSITFEAVASQIKSNIESIKKISNK